MYTCFRLVPKSITLDDLERINGRFCITISFAMEIFSLLRKNMSQTISNIRPRILLTINRKLTCSIDELRIIFQGSLYMHCCRASPLLQLGFFVVLSCTVSEIWQLKVRESPILPTPPSFNALTLGKPLRISG